MIADFEYFSPKIVEEALSLLSRYKEEAKMIAEGQSILVVVMKKACSPLNT
jgi:CO/xanthine dehydrogenase FAD-binding subunit